MKKGCVISAIIFLALAISALGYCGYSMYEIATKDMPLLRQSADKFVEYYNSDNHLELHKMYDSICAASVTKEKCAEQNEKIKSITGTMKITSQVNWSAQNNNGNKFVTVVYDCDGVKGKVALTIKFHMEDTWKIQGYNVSLK